MLQTHHYFLLLTTSSTTAGPFFFSRKVAFLPPLSMAASTSEGSCSSTGDLVAAVFEAPRGAMSSGI